MRALLAPERTFRTGVRLAALLAALIAAADILGWLMNSDGLKSFVARQTPMMPFTAVAMLLLASALALRWSERKAAPPAAVALSLGAAAIGLVFFLEYLLHANLGVDRLLFPHSVELSGEKFPGRMGGNTAVFLVLLGTGIALLGAAPKASRVLALLVFAGDYLAFAGYLYAVPELFAVAKTTSMAANTSIAFLLVAVGLFLTACERISGVLVAEGAGGHLARRLIFLAILAPPGVDILAALAESAGWIGPRLGAAVHSLVLIFVLGAVVMALSRRLESADQLRRQAEEQLRQREQWYRNLYESSYEGILASDLTGRLLEANPAAQQLLGYTLEELRARTYPELTPERWHAIDAAIRRDQIAARGFSDEYEKEYLRRDGTPIPITMRLWARTNERGEIVGTWALFRDNSERKRTEEALRRSEQEQRRQADFLARLVEHAPVAIAVIHAADLSFVMVNPAFEAIAGNVSPLVGRSADAFFPEPFRRSLEAMVRRATETGESAQLREFETPVPGKAESWWNAEILPLPPEGGRAAVLLLAWEITDSVLARKGLEVADRRKNEFLAMLSHELRNPLTAVRNGVYVLGRAPPGGAQAKRAQGVIERQVDHLTKLVDDLLDVSRIARGKIRIQKEPIDLERLVQRTVEDHRGLFAQNGIALELRRAGHSLPLNGDPTRLAQVVGNLLSNAAKFTPKGGRTTVTLEEQDGKAILRVQDTGAGISPALLTRVFEPFLQGQETLEKSRGGLGLGLALVKSLVELHGGSASAFSEGSGKGAELVIRLPLGVPEAERPTVPAAAPAPVSRRVLLIEDDRDVAESLRAALELSGHRVEVAESGAEGVAKARAFLPEFVLCGLGLPGTECHDLAQAIRADPQLRELTLVALSGHARLEDIERARAAGFDFHLAKPPDMNLLAQLLAQAPSLRPERVEAEPWTAGSP